MRVSVMLNRHPLPARECEWQFNRTRMHSMMAGIDASRGRSLLDYRSEMRAQMRFDKPDSTIRQLDALGIGSPFERRSSVESRLPRDAHRTRAPVSWQLEHDQSDRPKARS